MNDKSQNIIQAICNFDIDTVTNWMDEDVLHFQGKKDVAIIYLKKFFDWVALEKGESEITTSKVTCAGCYHEDESEITHEHAVLFQFRKGKFAFDIVETPKGLYQLDYCSSFPWSNGEPECIKTHFSMILPYDLISTFVPDDAFNGLLIEKENILSELDNGSIIFWFVEDFSAWLKKYEKVVQAFHNLRSSSYALGPIQEIISKMCYLHNGLMSEKMCEQANKEFELLNHKDLWAVDEWLDKYESFQFSFINPDILNLSHVKEGYFTFSSYLPHLRFSIYGHQDFAKFIHNRDLAFNITEAIEQDKMLIFVIEYEWSLNELWGSE